jgi:hypothetical protein
LIIPRLGRSVRELLQRLGDHVRGELGADILLRRLVEGLEARCKWNDGGRSRRSWSPIAASSSRSIGRAEHGASVWWISRPNAPLARPHATEGVAAVRLRCYQPGDITISNDGTEEQLAEQVDAALAAIGVDLELAR